METKIREKQLKGVIGVVARELERHWSLDEVCVVGTAATVLHGVSVPVGDVDFLMKERAGVDSFGLALADYRVLTPPSLLVGEIQYYAAYEVGGVKVEASTVEIETESEFMEVTGGGPWKHCSLVRVGRFMVPMVALELRLATELKRDRADRFGPISDHFVRHGETALLRAVLAAHELEEMYQEALRSRREG